MLRHEANDYLCCFQVKKAQLEQVFDEDEQRWANFLQQVKSESEQQQAKLKALLSRQKTELSSFLQEGLVMQ